MKTLCILSRAALATLVTTGAAQALTLAPPGLNPGDQYRLVFVTSTRGLASSTNINDYNNFVNNAANAIPEIAALGTTWTAIGSTSLVNAIDNTYTTGSGGVPIYNFGGQLVASNYPDLWDGSINAPINVTENGQQPSETDYVWTGTFFNGMRCAGRNFFTSCELGSTFTVGPISQICCIVNAGLRQAINEDWVDYWGLPTSFIPFGSYYGISGNLTVPQPPATVPEPSNPLSLITLGGLMLGSAVKKARQ